MEKFHQLAGFKPKTYLSLSEACALPLCSNYHLLSFQQQCKALINLISLSETLQLIDLSSEPGQQV